ncbi:transglutaminase family protein, partial [Nocardiopsis coralliicola]
MSRARAAVRELPVSAAAGAAVLAGMALLAPLVDGGGWWPAAAAAVLAVCGTGSAVRFAPGGTLLAPPVQLLALAAALTALFAPGGAPAELVGVFEQGTAAIEEHPPPVPPGTGLELILAGAAGVAALAADVLALAARTAALAGIPLFAMALVPLAVDDRGLSPAAFAAAGAGYLVLLAVDSGLRAAERTGTAGHGAGAAIRHTALSGAVVAGALAVALLVPALVPGLESGPMHRITDPAGSGRDVTATHPLVSLRRDLGSSGNRAVLTYTTDAERPQYLRTSVLESFDGTDWTMAPVTASDGARLGSDGALPEPPGLRVQRAGTATTEVAVEQPLGDTPFLPLPYPAASVRVAGDWYADPESLVVFSTSAQDAAGSYTVRGYEADPDPAELASSGTSGGQRSSLELPGDLDPRIAEATRSVTEGADDPLSKAVALQDWFTDRGRFTYDLAPPELPDGADPLAHFLFEDRIGYCEQFAAAMAVMARQAGIPARVAVGYTPGTQASGDQWVVREGDAHAWPELYFSGHGWLRFEPTPPGGQGTASTPPYGREAPEGDGAGEAASPAPDPSPDAEDGTGGGAADPPEEQPDSPGSPGTGPDPAASGGDASTGVPWAAAAAAVALALAVLLLPWAVRAAVRRARGTPA